MVTLSRATASGRHAEERTHRTRQHRHHLSASGKFVYVALPYGQPSLRELTHTTFASPRDTEA